MLSFVVTATAACGSSQSTSSLAITSPEKGEVLTDEDDNDPERSGLQYNVIGSSSGLSAGSTVVLFIDGQDSRDSAPVDDDGSFAFVDATLPAGTHTITARTSTGSVTSDVAHDYTFRTLIITAPEDGMVLTKEHDLDLDVNGIQFDVNVQAFGLELDQEVVLEQDGAQVGTATPDSDGLAVFSRVTFLNGSRTLVARSGDTVSESVTVTARESCASIAWVSPMPSSSGDALVVGGDDSCPTDGTPFLLDFQLSTDAGNGRKAELLVNGTPVEETTVDGASITFDDVRLTNRNSTNLIEIRVDNAEGRTCTDTFPGGIDVDCDGPDCTLSSPTPVTGKDEAGDSVLYVNASQKGTSGFDVAVNTDSDETVLLIIDGNSRNPIEATPTGSGADRKAVFEGVPLMEGPTTVEALCTDAAGNSVSTGVNDWVVDTVACTVTVDDPDADTVYVPADDVDNNATNGTQVEVSSTVGGEGCSGRRAGPCDPASGVDADFVTYDGSSPLLSTVTLDAASTEQVLCVEIEDLAGNVGLGTVDVVYRSATPMVLIQSPMDGDRFNVAGTPSPYIADSVPGSPCNADFWVACTELGESVELRHDNASGNIFRTASCEAAQGGDPFALPAGYAGRAHFMDAPFQDGGAKTNVIVATLAFVGDSGNENVGVSVAITLDSDCLAPAISFPSQQDPCNGGQLGDPLPPQDVRVVDLTQDGELAQITIDNTSFTMTMTETTTFNSDTASFEWSGLDFGAIGSLEITVDAHDAFQNTAQISCMADVVADLPHITIDAPDTLDAFGPRTGMEQCFSTGEYQIPVTVSLDQATQRTGSIKVETGGGGPVDMQTLSEGDISGGGGTVTRCMTLAEGANVIQADAESTLSSSTATPDTVLVALDSLDVVAPLPGSGVNTNCNMGGAFSVAVDASADAIHDGEMWTVTATDHLGNMTMDSGLVINGSIGACVAVANDGLTDFSVSVGAADQDVVGVAVLSTGPAAIDSLVATQPCDGMTAAECAHRTQAVNLAWTQPGESLLDAYLLRCANDPSPTPTSMPDNSDDMEDWWDNQATTPAGVTLPSVADVSPAVDIFFRVGAARHCVVRVRDRAGNLSAMPASIDAGFKFRQHKVIHSGQNAIGGRLAAVGDVNGDDIDDVLVGSGSGDRAALYFGAQDADWSSAVPDVIFTGSSWLARSVAGIGDFNDDGEDDFAIGAGFWNGAAGRVYIFFGRANDDWPASVDLTDSTGAACEADICLSGSTFSGMGLAVNSAGDFNNDGHGDVAIGAKVFPSVALSYGRLLVALGGPQYEDATAVACSGDGDCRSNDSCGAGNTCEPNSTFRQIEIDANSGDWLNPGPITPDNPLLRGFNMEGDTNTRNLGQALASLGPHDDTAGHDIAITALGCLAATCGTASDVPAKVFYLSGRDYNVGSQQGLITLPLTALATIDTGPATSFGVTIASVGNVYEPSNPDRPGARDLWVKQGVARVAYLYPGEFDYVNANADRIAFLGYPNNNWGTWPATGYHALLSGPIGDLDPTSPGMRADLCIDSDLYANATPGAVTLWYDDVLESSIDTQTLSYTTGARIEPTPADPDTAARTVQYVGDMTGDGFADLVVGDPDANGGRGEFWILY